MNPELIDATVKAGEYLVKSDITWIQTLGVIIIALNLVIIPTIVAAIKYSNGRSKKIHDLEQKIHDDTLERKFETIDNRINGLNDYKNSKFEALEKRIDHQTEDIKEVSKNVNSILMMLSNDKHKN